MKLTAYEMKCIDRTAEELIASSVDGVFIDDDVKSVLDSLDDIDIKAIVITPGGRVGNNTPFSRSRTDNWVARAGGLPDYVRIVAHGLVKKGKTESEAIHLAIGILKNWASGKGHVSAKVRAAAAKAIAQWEAMRASARIKKGAKKATRATRKNNNEKSLWDHPDNGSESKESGMQIEYKDIEVKGLTIDDDEQGIVTAIVSVTGIVDNVKDNIHPGAYNKTLAQRVPKGVWSHDWNSPVSRTLQAKELMPGDPALPEKQPNGEPWPAGAGALQITTQFNLKTQMGRDAFENVKFYGPEQSWSIGYKVPTGGAVVDTKTGVREIDTLELYEYSPVLFGAMSLAGTQSVKSAQIAWAEEVLRESKDIDDDDMYFKKKFSAAERRDLAKRGVAMPDGRYPINSAQSLSDAINDYNRTGQDPTVKKHIKKRARALGLTDNLPDSFGSKALDLDPYDDDEDDEDTNDGVTPTVQLSSQDISLLYTCIDHLKNLMETITGVTADDDGDDEDRDAIDEGDLSDKGFQPYTEFKEAQNLSALVDELLDYKDDIGNLDELSDYAEKFDDQLGSDDVDGAMDTASDFVKALEAAADAATDQDTASAIESVATDFAALLQDVAEDAGDDDTDDEEDDDGEGDDSEPQSKGAVVVEMKDLQELMSFK